jgi:hypothetical protein
MDAQEDPVPTSALKRYHSIVSERSFGAQTSGPSFSFVLLLHGLAYQWAYSDGVWCMRSWVNESASRLPGYVFVCRYLADIEVLLMRITVQLPIS